MRPHPHWPTRTGLFSSTLLSAVLTLATSSCAFEAGEEGHTEGAQSTRQGITSCETQQYTLCVTVDDPFDAAVLDSMKSTFFRTYPLLVQRFNPGAPSTVHMHIVNDPDLIAGASGDSMSFGIGYMLANPASYDVVVHEATHVVQSYPANDAGWLVEGIADDARDRYGSNNAAAGWALPAGYEYGQHYTAGYGVTARFLQWVEANRRSTIVDDLNARLRAGTYTDWAWVTLTGKSVETLWREYSGGTAPVPATSGITFYEHTNYAGRAVKLARGTYQLIDLEARGIQNDWISSLRVPRGYSTRVYEDDGLGGAYKDFSSSASSLVSSSWNDRVSSIVVK